MIYTLEQLAELTNSSFHGEKNTKLDSVAALTDAKSGQISFVSNPKYIKQLQSTSASAVILNASLADNYAGNSLINDDPYLTFARVLKILYAEPKAQSSVHKSAVIADTAKLHETVIIGPNVVIDNDVVIEKNVIIDANSYIGSNSHIGSDTHLHPNVSIYKESQIGKRCIVHSGAVIGADGFGFAPTPDKKWFKILQIGNVVIGKDVEVGANTAIDRAALGSTIISDGVKLDNFVHIGHNVKVDEHTVIAGGGQIAGSTNIGKRCQIGGAVGISGHLTIVDDVIITGKSMVIKSIKTAGVYSSGIATDTNRKWRKNAARFRNLDNIARKIFELEKKLDEK